MKKFLAWQGNQGEKYWSAVTKIRNMSNEDCIAHCIKPASDSRTKKFLIERNWKGGNMSGYTQG